MLKFLLGLFVLGSAYCAEDIAGFWKILDTDSKPSCVVAVYENDGVYYGRMIGSFNEHGVMKDTIYNPIARAPGVIGNPYYSGLDFIWDLVDIGNQFNGRILDPKKGNVYKAELWVENGNLIIRGRLLMFGGSRTAVPATSSDFPKGFKMPDVKTFVPTIPEVN